MRDFVKSAIRYVQKHMLFVLHTVPVALSADSKLIRNSVLLLP